MKVKAVPIVEFLEGRKESFLIPVYQRNYDWPKERCETLWSDLEAVVSNPHPHFFGSIVRVRNADDNIIIDGQQRLTTVSLLMLAIAHRTEVLGLDKPDLKEVMDLYQNGKRQPKIKLKLLRNDMQAYECIVANNKDCSDFVKSKIVQNYNLFYKKLDADNVEKIFEASKKLIVIDALLEEDDDNPQAVFESLNDKAEKLNDADKIRNFILMNFDYDQQQLLYNKYWSAMEKNVGISSDDTTKYIWRYIQYKNNNKIGDKYIYSEFKTYVQNRDKEYVLQDLYNMSHIYRSILQMDIIGEQSSQINERLGMLLNELKVHTTLPLLLDVIKEYEEQKVSGIDVVNILDVLISYIVRRGLVGYPNTTYNGFFLMNKDIHKILEDFPECTYLDAIKYKIYSATNRNENPCDNIVLESAINLGIYNKNTYICKYVLVQLEKYLMAQKDPNGQRTLNTKVLSIEHIMPQTLSGHNGSIWQRELGENWESVHRKYLHTLGNLTLTAYNSNLSNNSFNRKKQELQNFAALYLNESLEKTNVWNEEAICERGKNLAKMVLNLWPVYKPSNEYVTQSASNIFNLDNTNILDVVTKRKPKAVELQFTGNSLNVSNWRDLYVSIINELYNNNLYRAKMQNAFNWADKSDKFSGIISNNPQITGSSGVRLWEQIIPDNQIYFMTRKSADSICIAIKKWLEYLDIDLGDVSIILK